MKPKPPPNPPRAKDGIRPGFFWAMFLLAAAAVAALVFLGGIKPSNQAAHSGGAAQTNFSAAATIRPAPEKRVQPVPEAADATTAKLIAQLFDGSLPLAARRQAARTLARLGSATAMIALKSALADRSSPAYLKAAVAEGLGNCPSPEARGLLNGLINDPDEITARGAVRGLALTGDADAVNSLGVLLFNQEVPLSVRNEAALALGDVNLPGALDALTRAVTEITDQNVVENVLDGLGKRPFSETEIFFSSYLASQDTPAESKVAAIEALGNAQGGVSPFLLKYLGDPDADLRGAAAWALTAGGDTNDAGPQLTAALQQEADPKVRAQIYQALEKQSGEDPQAVLPLVQNESNPAAQLAGFTYLAETLGASPSPEVTDFFNQTAVPELENAALTSDSAQNRLAAVIALEQAGTRAASDALQEIAQQSTDSRVAASAQKTLSKQSQQ
jgi:HEAT repeat protein